MRHQRTILVYQTEPRTKSRVEMESSPISRESQSGVSMVRFLVERIYRKGTFWVYTESYGVMNGESGGSGLR